MRACAGGEPLLKVSSSPASLGTPLRAAVPDASPQQVLRLLTEEQRQAVEHYLAAEKARKVLAKLRNAHKG